jgi:hypothetical protein
MFTGESPVKFSPRMLGRRFTRELHRLFWFRLIVEDFMFEFVVIPVNMQGVI